jgi:hypothetical protein
VVRWHAAGAAAAAEIFLNRKNSSPSGLENSRGRGRKRHRRREHLFPECAICGTRGRALPVSRFPGSSSPSVALGEGFPECFWLFPECLRHSGKQVAPVVSTEVHFPITNFRASAATTTLIQTQLVNFLAGMNDDDRTSLFYPFVTSCIG